MYGPNLKGAVAEIEIAAAAIRLGVPVLRPEAEHGRYDLVLEIGGSLWRVQCKSGALDHAKAVIKVGLQGSRCTPEGYVRRSYAHGEIDLVAVYCDGLDRSYLLPAELATDRSSIYLRLTRPLNAQRASVNLASQFEFPGAVAQLEERSAGSRKAGGSSPPSSTPGTPSREVPQVVGAHQFRNHFGYYMERAATGEEILVTRRGRPTIRMLAAQSETLRGSVPPNHQNGYSAHPLGREKRAGGATPPSAPAPRPTASRGGRTRAPQG